MNDEHERIEELLNQALEVKPEQRAAFLAGACGEDHDLRHQVETLLSAAKETEGFLPDTPAWPAASSSERAGTVVGRYKLLEKLGEGGFGAVWAAEQREPVKRRIALKIIKLGMDTRQVVARFEAERQALALMDHPNIAKVLDAGATDTGRPYFVMELVKGIPITKYCEQEKLDTNQRLDLFVKVCHAIQHAHQKGIIHRDIKPSNVMVTLHDGVPVPKVIDFGIAKATQAELTEKTIYTQYHQFIGTPAYMSPEQAEMSGLDIDTRSDIYSLGVLLYELLTGSTPFDTKELLKSGLDEMRKIIREREPMRPSTRIRQTAATASSSSQSPLVTRHSSLATDLDWIVMKCLEKDRTRRYETANGLAMDIKRHLHHEPVVARPPSVEYRLRKAWRRNKAVFSAAAAVVMALSLGGAVSIWQGAVAQRARTAEESQRRAAEAAAVLAEKREEQMRRRAYAADMNLAHEAIQNNNLGRALELLHRYRPQPGKADLRGWEWRYLWALCQSDAEFQLAQFSGPDPVISVDISPDGKWAALGGYEQTGVRIWDISGRRELARLADGEEFCHVAFSPDGRLLAFTSRTGLGLWDCATREVVARRQTEHPIVSVGFSGDGRRIVTFSQHDAITIWGAKDLRRIKEREVPQGHAWLGSPFAFTPDLKRAVRVEDPRKIVGVDLESNKELWSYQSEKGNSPALAISPDGRFLVSGFGLDGNIYIFEMATGRQVDVLSGHRAWISSLVFWPDGTKLASASADQTIRIWDMRTRKPMHVLQGHQLEVWSLALSPDGERLLSGGKDGAALVWDSTTGPAKRNHWQLPGRHRTWSFFNHETAILTVARDSPRVLKLKGPNYSTTEVLSEIGRGDPAFSNGSNFRFSPSGRLLAVLSTNGLLSVWDVHGQERIRKIATGTKNGIVTAFSKDNARIWLGTSDTPIPNKDTPFFDFFEWDLQTGQLVRSITRVRGPYRIHSDEWVFGRSRPQVGVFHDLKSGKTSHPMMFPGRLANLFGKPASSPDGKLLAVSHDAGYLTVWETKDLRSGNNPEPIRTVGGILMSFRSSGFSPDGTRLFGCSHGSEAIKIWDTATYHELLTLPAEGAFFGRPRFSPNGNDLVSRAGVGAVVGKGLFVWRAASWEEIKQAEARGTR